MKRIFKALLTTTILSMQGSFGAVELTEMRSPQELMRQADAAFSTPCYNLGQELLTETYNSALSAVELVTATGGDINAAEQMLISLIQDISHPEIDPIRSAEKYLANGNIQMAQMLLDLAQRWDGLWNETDGEMKALSFSRKLSSQIELHENLSTLLDNPSDWKARERILQLAMNPHISIHEVLVAAHKLYENKNYEAAERLLVVVVLNNRHDDATPDQISYAFMLKETIEKFLLQSGDYMTPLIAEIYGDPSSGNVEQQKEQLVDCVSDRHVSVDRVLELAVKISNSYGDHATALKLLIRLQLSNREPEATQVQLNELMWLRSGLNKAVEIAKEKNQVDLKR
jgi:hypothetical protein